MSGWQEDIWVVKLVRLGLCWPWTQQTLLLD